MKIHSPYTHKRLQTCLQKSVIIGGEIDLCAERFGYKREISGISPYFASVAVEPAATRPNIIYATNLPAHGFALVFNKAGQVYKWNKTEFSAFKSAGIINSEYPFMVHCVRDGKEACALYSKLRMGLFFADGQTVTTLPNALKCGAMHCGRVFARDFNDPYLLRWSSYDIRDWTEGIDEGGHIRFDPRHGEVLDVFEMGEKLVLVRTFGITVMSAMGDARHFRLEQTSNLILPDAIGGTSAICGGQLYVYTAEGLVKFNGSTVERTSIYLPDGYIPEHCKAYLDRYIYYECKRDGENYIVEYDTQSGAVTPFGKGCHGLFFYEGDIYCFDGDTLCVLEKGASDVERIWTSKAVDLGTASPKTLKKIRAEGEGDFTVHVRCDGRNSSYRGAGERCVGERGKSFVFTVTGSGAVTKLTAEWEVNK